MAHSWDLLGEALADDYHVFALDQRGHGDSEWPRPPSYMTSDFVEDLRAVADAWGLWRFALIGQSMGASILLKSLAHENRLRAVVADCPFATFLEIARRECRAA